MFEGEPGIKLEPCKRRIAFNNDMVHIFDGEMHPAIDEDSDRAVKRPKIAHIKKSVMPDLPPADRLQSESGLEFDKNYVEKLEEFVWSSLSDLTKDSDVKPDKPMQPADGLDSLAQVADDFLKNKSDSTVPTHPCRHCGKECCKWKEAWSDKYLRPYWWNAETRKTTWVEPAVHKFERLTKQLTMTQSVHGWDGEY